MASRISHRRVRNSRSLARLMAVRTTGSAAPASREMRAIATINSTSVTPRALRSDCWRIFTTPYCNGSSIRLPALLPANRVPPPSLDADNCLRAGGVLRLHCGIAQYRPIDTQCRLPGFHGQECQGENTPIPRDAGGGGGTRSWHLDRAALCGLPVNQRRG